MRSAAGMARLSLIVLFAFLAAAGWQYAVGASQSTPGDQFLIGRVLDPQDTPLEGAAIRLVDGRSGEVIAEATSQPDGRYTLPIKGYLPQDPLLMIERDHYKTYRQKLGGDLLGVLAQGGTISLPSIALERQITAAFWIATLVFVLVLVLIATGLFHNTLATLIGVTLIYAVSYLGPRLHEGLYIFDFQRSLHYIDWNVIFLIMGMMIVIAVVEETGIFQWLAFFAYRISGGRPYILLPILMLITGVASALLDNVTTMLLMTPITVQIALVLGIDPLAFILPEVMASNVVGVSTLIGTPTNILIGSSGQISFNGFLANLTPGVLLAFVGLILYSAYIYRKDLGGAQGASELLLERLSERSRIQQPEDLKKAGVVGAGMIALFILGERFHLLPAVTAIMGATALLVWIRPDIEKMIEAVDWTTLVFFLALFITVGAIQEVGLIGMIAALVGRVVGDNLLLAMLGVTWLSALLSMVIANIPFTAAMLPVVGFLTRTVPGAGSKALYFCLSVGSAMGGNGSLMGASANMVTAGISESAGYPISYAYFFKKGLPALLITVGLAFAWLLIRFL